MTARRRTKAKTGRGSRGARSRLRPQGSETKVEQLDRELAQALAQQGATSEILDVISRSPEDLQRVFQTILANATRLCEAKFATFYLLRRQRFHCCRDAQRARGLRQVSQAPRRDPSRPRHRARPDRPHQARGPYRRYHQGNGVSQGRSDVPQRRQARWLSQPAVGSTVAAGQADRNHRDPAAGGAPVFRPANRGGQELRRAGGHRDRECPPAQ